MALLEHGFNQTPGLGNLPILTMAETNLSFYLILIFNFVFWEMLMQELPEPFPLGMPTLRHRYSNSISVPALWYYLLISHFQAVC